MFEDMFIAEDEKVIVDLHNMEENEAKFFLEMAIDTAEPKIKEIVVIHGYRQGQVILNMVRKEFNHKRIDKKIIPFNKRNDINFIKERITSFILDNKMKKIIIWNIC